MKSSNLTAPRLRELLDYDRESGSFTWRINAGLVVAGATAGSIHRGYVNIGVDGKRYRAHRLAWLHEHGSWPSGQIDHIDGDRANNRLSNLRDACGEINAQNRRHPRSDNKSSGLMGVKKFGPKWQARIQIDGRYLHLGTHPTPEHAHAAYIEAKRRLHPGCTI